MKKDEVCKIFFEDNERVADLLNMYTTDSEKISANDIHEADSGLIFKIREGINRPKVSKARDIVRKVAFNTTFIIVDIEPQDNIDYSYPLRDLCYIYGEYEKQARAIRKRVKKHPEGLSTGERLYSFTCNSRLNPTVIILLYSGEKEWDGPTQLWDMLDMSGIPEGLKKLVMNHRIHMIDIRRLPEEILNNFETDVGKVFKLISYSNDKKKYSDLIQRDSFFHNLTEDTYDMISEFTNSSKQLDKESMKTETGGYDMCKALEDYYESSKQEGITIGISQGISQGKEMLLIAQIKDGEISIESAAKRMDMTPKEFADKYKLSLK